MRRGAPSKRFRQACCRDRHHLRSLVGFVAVQVWNDFDRAKLAVAAEARALRGIVILAESVPAEQRGDLRRLVNRHIEQAVTHEWGVMAQRRLTMETMPTHLIDARKVALALQPADETQRMVQREIINDVHRALEARRQRIVVSQTSVSVVKWAAILLQGLCALVAIAMVHSDNRLTCAIALAIFAMGIAVSVLLIAAYSRPLTEDFGRAPAPPAGHRDRAAGHQSLTTRHRCVPAWRGVNYSPTR